MNDRLGVLRLPAEIRFGAGARHAVPKLATTFGSRVLVVADPFLATTAVFVELLDGLQDRGSQVEVLTDVPAELPIAAVHEIADRARALRPDVVVGYGGGSALDAAKLVALLCTHGGRLSDYYGENAVPGPVVPVVAVPTTAGTGSEVTPVAVVSDPDREVKVGVSSPELIPRVAVVDPDLTHGAPAAVTRHAGIDAFVHAVESLTARRLPVTAGARLPVFVGRNALTEPVALDAAMLIHRALPRVLDDPDDEVGREEMARGSLLAGVAFGVAGTHLSHAIQYPVGAMTRTPHGLGTGTLLPYVLQACATAEADMLARIGGALGLSASGSAAERAQATVDEVAALCERVGLPVSLQDLGVQPTDVERIVELTLPISRLLAIAPIRADADAITRIVVAAIDGDRERLRTQFDGKEATQ